MTDEVQLPAEPVQPDPDEISPAAAAEPAEAAVEMSTVDEVESAAAGEPLLAEPGGDEDDEELAMVESVPVEQMELPAPEAEEVKAALRELRASAMRAATTDSAPDLSEAPDDRAWFVVHCYSGYENKVKHNLEQRIESMGMANQIFQVVVPTEEEIEVKEGKRRTVERRVFPGYILVQMLMNDDSWYVVRNTPGVTGFVGMGNKPTPLRQEEVQGILKRMEAEAPKVKVTFKPGQKVRIVDGPFNDFMGTVDEINMDKAKVRVMVSFFGRETPVELDFLQVEKM